MATRLCNLDHDHKHGETGYCWSRGGCRCKPCSRRENKRVSDAYKYSRRIKGLNRRVPALGTARRLQGLACMGWSCRDISEHTGIDIMHVNELRRHVRDRVLLTTHDKIVAVYKELSDRRNDGRSAAFTAMHALRQGWVPPAGWDHPDNPRERPKGVADAA